MLQPENIAALAISGVIYGLVDMWKKRRKLRRNEVGGGGSGPVADKWGGTLHPRTERLEDLRTVKGEPLEDVGNSGDIPQ